VAQELVPALNEMPDPEEYAAALSVAVRLGGLLDCHEFAEEMMDGYEIQANAALFRHYKVTGREIRAKTESSNFGRQNRAAPARMPREKTPEKTQRRKPDPYLPKKSRQKYISPGGTLGYAPYVPPPTWYKRVCSILPPITSLNYFQSVLGSLLLMSFIYATNF
jgi:hypothetical protein